MRISKQWLGIAAAGIMLGSACSSSDENPNVMPDETAGMSSSDSAGSAGSKPNGNEAGAGAGGTAGAPVEENLAGAGAGGCNGDYLCPAVLYWSHAIIKVDLPIEVADAANAVFTACRNTQCHSAKGSAKVTTIDDEDGWVITTHGETIYLNFDDSGSKPFAVLDWTFAVDFPIAGDHYSLTVQPVAAAEPTTLIDVDLKYTTTIADPELVSLGFCHHCSEVSIGTLDARAGH